MHNFKELNSWKEAKDLSVLIYKVTKDFPISEIYGISAQINRAVVSIPSNIAEGAGRISDKDFSRFIGIAIGSSFELETQLIIANELSYISNEKFEELILKLNNVQKMLVNFQKHLSK
jgi:four helix bundle protein